MRLSLRALVLMVLTPVLIAATLALGVVVYHRLYGAILDGFAGKLVQTSAATSAFLDGDAHLALTRMIGHKSPQAIEAEPAYRRMVAPMRRIAHALGLTYLYTQVVGGHKDIFYVLDETVGKGHSRPGDEDTVPPRTMEGLRRCQADGQAFVSQVTKWQEWGLLKSGFAPLYDHRGRIVATVGADVDITVIRDKTEEALFDVAAAGLAALLFGVGAAWWAGRRISRPIRAIKMAAFRLAAGRDEPVAVAGPAEISQLGQAFNTMSQDLRAGFAGLEAANRQLDDMRRRRFLADLLLRGAGAAAGGQTASDPGTGIDGLAPPWRGVVLDGRGLAWIPAASDDDWLVAARRASDMAELARRILVRGSEAAAVLTLARSVLGPMVARLAWIEDGRLTELEAPETAEAAGNRS